MIRRNRAKSSSLFLLELILAILFFSIASAVCVQFFVKSHLLSQDARELNVSVTEVSNAAELINISKDARDAVNLLLSEYPDAAADGTSGVSIYYDKNFLACKEESATYCLTAGFSQEGTLLKGTLDMKDLKEEDSIYSLDITHHLQRRDSNGI